MLAAALLAPPAGGADEESEPEGEARPSPVALDATLSADAVYERVLANRFDAAVQEFELASGDRSGREQPIRMLMLWRRYGDATPEASEGVLSRTLLRYLKPADVKNTGYLVIQKRDLPDDQFVYLDSMRRTRRISLRSESLVGTDLSAEDIVPREMEQATYARAADELVDEIPCYVIDAVPTESADSNYSKLRLYVEGAHHVPLRTRYWDRAGVEVKLLAADPASIREVDGVWIPIDARMTHLQEESYTRLRLLWIAPDPELPERFFTQRQLESAGLRIPKAVKKAARALE